MLDSSPASQLRIATLRKRWDADRTSSAFLPLAEEYRRLGRFNDAIEALEAGLKVQPSYLSAQVALGRCRLESGDATGAGAVLERVVATDPTQLVANKLLVEAHLRSGLPEQALRRLEAYAAFNDRDPDLPQLRQRILSSLRSEPPVVAPREPSPLPPDLAEPVPAGRFDGNDLFALPVVSALAPDLSSLWVDRDPAAPGSDLELQSSSSGTIPWMTNGEELFPGLALPSQRQRYLTALFAEGLFGAATVAVVVPDSPPPAPPSSSESAAVASPDSLVAAAEGSPLGHDVVAVADEPAWPPTASLLVAPAPSATLEDATVTLGELYLGQGHLLDAAQIFSAVLDRDPGNPAARSGLALSQEASDSASAPDQPVVLPEGVTARKIHLLRGYLEGIRRGASRDVS